jgi:hypothetical protein
MIRLQLYFVFGHSPYDPEQDYIMQRVNMFLGVGA